VYGVPWTGTEAIRQLRPDLISAYYFPHDTGINYETFAMDHQQSSEGMTFGGYYGMAVPYLLNRLMRPEEFKNVYYLGSSLMESLAFLRQKHLHGADLSWLRPRLLELCVPNVWMTDINTNTVLTGRQFLANAMTLWGWSESESTVCTQLQIQSQ